MEATATAIRVYASTQSYGNRPRTAPAEKPFEVHDFPDRADRCLVWFGPVPEHLRDAIRVRFAIASTLLNRLVGKAGADDFDVEVEAQLAREPTADFDESPWYVTLALERPVALDDRKLTSARYGWIDPRELESDDERLRKDAPLAFEMIVAAMVDDLGPRLFQSRAIRDVFYVIADGRDPLFFPRLTTSANVSTGRSIESFPAASLQARLEDLSKHGRSEREWLARSAYWYVAMLETDDPWKRFFWGVFPLEVLTRQLVKRVRSQAIAALHMCTQEGVEAPAVVVQALVADTERMPLASQFALVAGYLAPATADDDLSTFRAIFKKRGALAHGDRVEADDLPTLQVADLLRRYFELALRL